MQADVVRLGHAGVLAVKAVDLFKVGVGDLADVLADLDLRDDVAVLVLDGRELVHAAEHRLAARGDEPLAHAEAVDLRALAQQPAIRRSSSALDTVILQSGQPASSSILRAFFVR